MSFDAKVVESKIKIEIMRVSLKWRKIRNEIKKDICPIIMLRNGLCGLFSQWEGRKGAERAH